MTIKETINKVREIGSSKTRVTPTISGKVKLEILTSSGWVAVLNNVDRAIAEDVLQQASRSPDNRTIYG